MQARLVILGSLVAFFSIESPYFLTAPNLFNVLIAVAVVGTIANAQTLLLVAGQVDVSVGSGVALASAAFAVVAEAHGVAWGLVAALLAEMVVVAVNATAIVKFRVSSIIVTLAAMVAFRGVAKLVMNGRAVPVFGFDAIGQQRIDLPGISIPVAVLLLLAVTAFFFYLMRFTRYGQHMYAIGANPQAARLSGLHLERDVVVAFILSGCTVTLGALILTSQTGVVDPTTGQGLEFLSLTGVMIGGASLYGGRGTVIGTLTAILILAVLDNGLVLTQVVSFWQEVLRGGLLLGAVVFDELGRRSKDARMTI